MSLYYKEHGIKIFNNDCLNIMDEMIKRSIKIDAIITDPPYKISKKSGYVNNSPDKTDYIKKYGKHSIDFGEWDKKEFELESFIEKSYKILIDSGTILSFYDIWKIKDFRDMAKKYKFKQPRVGVWRKTNPVPINSKLNYLSNASEYFVSFVKKSKPTFNSKYDNANYDYPICSGKERTSHPTQKPLKLIVELILKHTNEGDTVFDPYMGSGTTAVACKQTGRKFVGVELSKEYCEIAKQRIINTK